MSTHQFIKIFWLNNQPFTPALLVGKLSKLGKLYPLMDHDHAFDEEDEILSQTWEGKTLFEAAKCSQKKLKLPIEKLLDIKKPHYLKDQEWEKVKERAKALIK